jgi:DNA-directed RNA polymerase specialized sigma subunit
MGYATKNDLRNLKNELLKELSATNANVSLIRGDLSNLTEKFNQHTSIECRLLEATSKVNNKDYSYNNNTERDDMIFVLSKYHGKENKEIANMFNLSPSYISEIIRSYT